MSLSCIHTKVGISLVEVDGFVKPCCVHRDDKHTLSIWDIDRFEQVLDSGTHLNSRTMLESGQWPSNCIKCANQEASSITSRRMETNLIFGSPGRQLKEGKIQDLEISLDYTCNMMCRICNPLSSSRWGAAGSVVSEMIAEDLLSNRKMPSYSDYARRFKHVMENTDLSHARVIKIEGGEPFYSKNLDWFLDKVSKEVINKDALSVRIFTNGSIFPNDDLLCKLITLNPIITFSIDGIGRLANTTRWGVNWDDIDANIQKWRSVASSNQNVTLNSNITISMLNVNKASEIAGYCTANDIMVSFSFLVNPEYLSIYQLSKECRQRWMLDGFDGFNSGLMANRLFDNQFDRMLQHIEILDRYQGMRFADANPCIDVLIRSTP